MNALKILFALIVVLFLGFLTFLFLTKSAIRTSTGKYIVGYSPTDGAMIFNRFPAYNLIGNSGPFVRDDSILTVVDGQLIKQAVTDEPIQVVSAQVVGARFNVSPKYSEVKVPGISNLRDSTFVVSDIEGNFLGLVALLQAHKIIDRQLNWSFGANELVALGDFMDRGKEVEQVLWFLRKLEIEAQQVSGQVSFVLGNHEVMNLQGDWSYVNDGIKALSTVVQPEVSNEIAYRSFYDKSSFFGQWLLSKPTMIRRGNYLFVHGGLHPDMANQGLGLEEINREVITALSQPIGSTFGTTASWLLSAEGPLWYRGLVRKAGTTDGIENRQLTRVLHAFGAERVVVGHTVVDQVSTDYSGRVIRIDVNHDQEKASAKTQGLLIVGETLSRADATGALDRM